MHNRRSVLVLALALLLVLLLCLFALSARGSSAGAAEPVTLAAKKYVSLLPSLTG